MPPLPFPLAPAGLSIEQQEEVDAPQIDGADKCIMHTYTHRKFVVSLCVCVCGLFGQNNKLICKQPQQSQPSEILPFRHCSRNFVVFFFLSALVGGLRVCVRLCVCAVYDCVCVRMGLLFFGSMAGHQKLNDLRLTARYRGQDRWLRITRYNRCRPLPRSLL